MCCGGDSTAAGLEKAQAADSAVFFQDSQISFAENQNIQAQLAARMQYMASNPMGLPPAQLATAATSINENTATAAKHAIGAAAAYSAGHGSADVGGSGVGQAVGQATTEIAGMRSKEQADLANLNASVKNQNMWNAIGGLSQVGAGYGGGFGTGSQASQGAADASVNAGKLLLASQQAGWADIGGMMSGIGSLAGGVGGLMGGIGKMQGNS